MKTEAAADVKVHNDGQGKSRSALYKSHALDIKNKYDESTY